MALIVEDGTIVTNADSWVSRADYIAYALTLGVTIADTDAADVQLVKAGEYINRHEDNLKGYLVDRNQSMKFPRYDLWIEGFSWTHEEIPRQVILAQMAFALDLNDGIDLYNRPVNPNLAVTRERVEGAIDISYAVGENAPQKLGRTSTGDALLASLLRSNGLYSVSLERR